jgi:hypothetical protein
MKNLGQTKNENTRFNNNRTAPEVRDNLDSRSNEEFDTLGGKTTNNNKPTKEDKLKKKPKES